jgi:hypothetical protein
MDHVSCRQAEALGEFGISGATAAQLSARTQQFGSGGAMNGPVNATAAEQRGVGCVNDGVNLQCRYVLMKRVESGGHWVGVQGYPITGD